MVISPGEGKFDIFEGNIVLGPVPNVSYTVTVTGLFS